MRRWVVIGLGLVFLVLGLVLCLVIGKPTVDMAKASKSWPTTDGEVIESRVKRVKSNRRKGDSYQVEIIFEYEVEGQRWTSNRPWFGSDIATNDPNMVQGFVNECPKGKDVTVYYDPENPAEAVLQPGASISSYFMMIFGAVFALVGAVIFLVAVFAGQRNKVLMDHPSTFSN